MKLYMGIGIPGCGKTTFLKPLAETEGLIYINADDIRAELTGDATNHSREEEVWSVLHSRVANALRSNGAVVDATFTRRRTRREIITIAQQAGISDITAYWFTTPLETCLKRNSARERVVPERAIRAMHHRLSLNPPSIEEGFLAVKEVNG